MEKSRLLQLHINDASQASRIFDTKHPDGIPVVLVPSSPMVCTGILNIPSGVNILYQTWGVNKGYLAAGVQYCWPAYNRISHIVTMTAITYDAPMQLCATRDNVRVNVDISLVFRIGPGEEEVVKFVYGLGATRFDELLWAEVEEAIRGLVFSVDHDKVHDLREEFAIGMLNGLNTKFRPFGVSFISAKITNVALPASLRDVLQSTTEYKTRLSEQEHKHKSDKLRLENTITAKLTELRRNNERAVQDARASLNRAAIERQQSEVAERAKFEEAKTDAESKASVARTKAEAERQVSQRRGQRDVDELRLATDADNGVLKMEVMQRAESRVTSANAQADAAEAIARALVAEAEAESEAGSMLQEKRAQELALETQRVLREVAAERPVHVGGGVGDSLLKALVGQSIEGRGGP